MISREMKNVFLPGALAFNANLLTGDGMGIPSITAGRILKGQLQGRSGEETKLAMDKFDHVGLSKVREIV